MELGPVSYSYVLVISAVGVYWLLENILKSPFGRATIAVRDHEDAAMALGVNAARQKIIALVISAVLAGFAGNLYAFRELYVNPVTFELKLAFLLLFMAIIGGVGSTAGAAIGAAVVMLLPEFLSGMGTEFYFLFYGVATILIIIFVPKGLVGLPRLLYEQIHRLVSVYTDAQDTEQVSLAPIEPVSFERTPTTRAHTQSASAILKVEEATKHFGGITAVNSASFQVQQGTITALIGPNGAGKTTLFNLICGIYKPDRGSIFFEGGVITGAPPYSVARKGLIRTFQLVSLFPEMTVYENLVAGAYRWHGAGLVSSAFRLPRFQVEEAKVRQIADELFSIFELGPWRDVPASSLPFGLQRSAETARAMAAAPKLLLLDEPAAGLNDEELLGLKTILRRLRDDGVTILLIEHNLPLVIDLSDWVVVLDFGKVIAQGTPVEVQNNPEVIAAYVGTPGRRDSRVATGA
jgi:branched-chain amino acid transport system permease protein